MRSREKFERNGHALFAAKTQFDSLNAIDDDDADDERLATDKNGMQSEYSEISEPSEMVGRLIESPTPAFHSCIESTSA